MLELDHLSLIQQDFALNAHWRIEAGARVAVIGPSGAGKSTLLSAIAGFVAPQGGDIRVQGQSLLAQEPGARPLSILFQDSNLFPHLTVEENLALGLSPRLQMTAQNRAAIGVALERVGLADKAKRKPATLSGGEQSRAALARTLLRARPLLLLDEPFAALGPALKGQMLDLLADLSGGTTLLMVTHDPRDARRLCPQTVLVADGIAHPPQPTEALLADPPPALRAYLG